MMQRRHSVIAEGEMFSFPVGNGDFGVGLVARTDGRDISLGYFFRRKFNHIPTIEEVGVLHSSDVVYISRFGALGFKQGTWNVIGHMPSWDRDSWPMVSFWSKDPLTGRLHRHDFPDDNPHGLGVRRPVASRAEIEGLPEGPGLAGHRFVELRMGRLLHGATDASS